MVDKHTFWNIPSIPGMLAVCTVLGFTIYKKSKKKLIKYRKWLMLQQWDIKTSITIKTKN
jgi:hypothetical protein